MSFGAWSGRVAQSGNGGRMQTLVVWGAIAEVALGTMLFLWLTSPSAAESVVFGKSAALALALVAMATTVVGVVTGAGARPTVVTWLAALILAVTAGLLGTTALIGIVAPTSGGNTGTSMVLALAVIGMLVVAARGTRRRPQ